MVKYIVNERRGNIFAPDAERRRRGALGCGFSACRPIQHRCRGKRETPLPHSSNNTTSSTRGRLRVYVVHTRTDGGRVRDRRRRRWRRVKKERRYGCDAARLASKAPLPTTTSGHSNPPSPTPRTPGGMVKEGRPAHTHTYVLVRTTTSVRSTFDDARARAAQILPSRRTHTPMSRLALCNTCVYVYVYISSVPLLSKETTAAAAAACR